MKLIGSSEEENIELELYNIVNKIAVTNVTRRSHLDYADAEVYTSGVENLKFTRCKDRNEFIANINKSKFLHLSIKDDYFQLVDTSQLLGTAPLGLYQAVDKKVALVLKNDEYRLQQFLDYDGFASGSQNVLFKGGSLSSWLGDIRLVGTTSNSVVGEGHSLLLGSDLVLSRNQYATKVSQEDGVVVRGSIASDEFSLKEDGLLYLPALAVNDSVLLNVIGKNNGFLMASCFVGFVEEFLLNKKMDLLDACSAGMIFRAFKLYKQKKIEVVAPIPVDVKTLRFERLANNKVEVTAIKKDDSETVVLRTAVLAATSRFVIADYEQVFPTLQLPVLEKRASFTDRNGSLVAAFKSPALDDYDILASPKFDVSVVSGSLVVSGVTTSISVAQATAYVLTIEKGADLTVELFNISAQTEASFINISAVYTYSVAQDGLVTWKSGIDLGAWALSPSLTEVEKAIQIVRADTENGPSGINLGSYSDGSFENYSSTFVVTDDDQVLTVSGSQYTRIPYNISSQVQNILRLDSTEVTGSVNVQRKSYNQRESALLVYCEGADIEGYNDSNLLCKIDNPTEHNDVRDPDFHKVVEGKKISLHCILIDAQTQGVFHKPLPEKENWSITLDCR